MLLLDLRADQLALDFYARNTYYVNLPKNCWCSLAQVLLVESIQKGNHRQFPKAAGTLLNGFQKLLGLKIFCRFLPKFSICFRILVIYVGTKSFLKLFMAALPILIKSAEIVKCFQRSS
jgi:hypothetical protein